MKNSIKKRKVNAFGKKANSIIKEIKIHKYFILISLLFCLIASVANYYSSIYASKVASDSVSDIILDNIPSVNLQIIFIWGFYLTMFSMFLYPLIFNVKKLHIVINQFSLLVIIRAIFITLTHLGVPKGIVVVDCPAPFNMICFQNDLFFSGHVALTFLGFLLFKKEKIGFFFLVASLIMAITVLLMHVHYSIDVFAAFFIAYGSYRLGNSMCKICSKWS